jgi:PleD family two-component response regulator
MANLDLSDLTVLIVDDYPPMRTILRIMLQALGIRDIGEANDGLSALEAMQAFRADIVIADYRMVPVNGVELTHRIRGGDAGIDPFTPVIMVSGHSEKSRICEARDAGVTEFLVKPISATFLYHRLRAVIENPRPFIRSPDFFGPDRRRRRLPFEGPDRRKVPYEYMGRERENGRAE